MFGFKNIIFGIRSRRRVTHDISERTIFERVSAIKLIDGRRQHHARQTCTRHEQLFGYAGHTLRYKHLFQLFAVFKSIVAKRVYGSGKLTLVEERARKGVRAYRLHIGGKSDVGQQFAVSKHTVFNGLQVLGEHEAYEALTISKAACYIGHGFGHHHLFYSRAFKGISFNRHQPSGKLHLFQRHTFIKCVFGYGGKRCWQLNFL